ncbi:MAG: DUF3108 domain-containing protein, partial [Casimicrobium sp.]
PSAQTSVATAKPKPKPRPKPQPNAAVAALPSTEPVVAQNEPVVEKAPEPTPEPKKEEPAVEKIAEMVPEKKAEEPAPPAPPALDPSKLPPKKIQLGYTAFLGENRAELGPLQLTFTHENGRYKLRAAGRARILFTVVSGSGESEGVITEAGLRPDRYIEERGSPDKRREVVFDHPNKRVKLPEGEPIVIDGNAHDRLTWIVQFYFALPKGDNTTFTVVDTRRLDTYTLERTGKDNIATPVGNVDTQIWKGSRKPRADGSGGGGSAQFWLAPDWHFIPFQVKVVDARGRTLYLELNAINAE